MNIKGNAVRVIARKAFPGVVLKPGERFLFRVLINGKEIPVELRPGYQPGADVEGTIASYKAKLLELRKEIEKLEHVCGLASDFEK